MKRKSTRSGGKNIRGGTTARCIQRRTKCCHYPRWV